jgi:hypothetical protein
MRHAEAAHVDAGPDWPERGARRAEPGPAGPERHGNDLVETFRMNGGTVMAMSPGEPDLPPGLVLSQAVVQIALYGHPAFLLDGGQKHYVTYLSPEVALNLGKGLAEAGEEASERRRSRRAAPAAVARRSDDVARAVLDAWKAEVLAAARAHPARSYRLGVAQIEAFADLLGNLNTAPSRSTGMFGGVGPTMREAAPGSQSTRSRAQRRARHATSAASRTRCSTGCAAPNPTAIASLLYNGHQATPASTGARSRAPRWSAPTPPGRLPPAPWATTACGRRRTSAQLQALQAAAREQGLRLADVRDATNYGRAQRDWVRVHPAAPALPARVAALRARGLRGR